MGMAQTRWQSYGWLLVNVITWGAALVIVKPALDHTTPFRYLWYRYILATLLALPILFYFWPKLKHKLRTILVIVGIELLGTTLALSLLYIGLAHTTSIESGLLATTEPIFVVVAGVLLLKEKQEEHEWVGLGVALGGTLLLTAAALWQAQAGEQPWHTWLTAGSGLIVIYNVITAAYFILAKKYYAPISKWFTAAVSFVVGLITFGLLSWWEAGSLTNLHLAVQADRWQPSVWIASVYMAVFGSLIGLTAYLKGQDGIEASEASLFWYLQPLVYIPLGMWWLGEQVTVVQLIGLGAIVAGVIIAEHRRRVRRRRLAVSTTKPTHTRRPRRRVTSRSHS